MTRSNVPGQLALARRIGGGPLPHPLRPDQHMRRGLGDGLDSDLQHRLADAERESMPDNLRFGPLRLAEQLLGDLRHAAVDVVGKAADPAY
jgi:hypothetical protein